MNTIQGPRVIGDLELFWVTHDREVYVFRAAGTVNGDPGSRMVSPTYPRVFLAPIFEMRKSLEGKVKTKFKGGKMVTVEQLSWLNSHCLSELQL